MNPCPSRVTRGVGSILLAAAMVLIALQSGCQDSNALKQQTAEDADRRRPEPRLRVQVEPVKQERLASADRVTGTVRAFHRATITAETQGRVLHRKVESGASVEKGEVLIELESSRLELELRRSEASLRAAKTVLSHAKRDYDRAEQLLAQNAMSTQRWDEMQHGVNRARDEIALAEVVRDTAKRNLEDAQIKAPFSGTVDSLSVDVGDFVTQGTAVATLVDLSRVRIFGGVTASEATRLEPGMSARVSFADLGGASFEATLQSVGHVAGSADGTYDIELWMEPVGSAMRDGLVAQIELTDPNQAASRLVRRASILRRDGHPEIFVVVQENAVSTARVRRVRTGRSEGDWIEILDGLEIGDLVVWDGHFALEDGSSVVVDGARTNVADADSRG